MISALKIERPNQISITLKKALSMSGPVIGVPVELHSQSPSHGERTL